MSLSIPFPFGWLLNKKAASVEVNISLAFLHWVGIALNPSPFVSDMARFVLKGDVTLQLTNFHHVFLGHPVCLIPYVCIVVQRMIDSVSSLHAPCSSHRSLPFLIAKVNLYISVVMLF